MGTRVASSEQQTLCSELVMGSGRSRPRIALLALLGLAAACEGCDSPLAAGESVVFESDWTTAIGSDSSAVMDGGRWNDWWAFGTDPAGPGGVLSVVPEGLDGRNVLRVQQRGAEEAASLQLDDFIPQRSDFYLRFYLRNDDTSRTGDDVVTVNIWGSHNLVYLRKASSARGWNFLVAMSGCADYYPVGHWGPAPEQLPEGDGEPQLLARGEWYRFEYYVHFTSTNHIQIHPRVYDASGALLFADADFRQNDPGSATWNGRSDWTLASYYAAGYDLCVDPTFVNDLAMGNPGQLGAVDTGLSWYFTGVQIRTDGWPGP
jgi:hypothetical protein